MVPTLQSAISACDAEDHVKVLIRGKNDPRRYAVELFFKTVWDEHPARNLPIGSRETLANSDRRVLMAFREANFLASNMVTAVVGDQKHEAIVDRAASYSDAKIALYEQRLEAQQDRVTTLQGRVDEVAEAIQGGDDLGTAERLSLTTLLSVWQEQLAAAQGEVLTVQQLLTQARDVERGRIVAEASAARVDARSTRTSSVVGAFIGLVLGALAALLWGPIVRLRAP